MEPIERKIENLKDERSIAGAAEQRLLNTQIDSLKHNLKKRFLSFIQKHPSSEVSLYTIHSACFKTSKILDKTAIKQLFNCLSPELQTTTQGDEIVKFCKSPDAPRIGDKAIDFQQKTPQGTFVRLSDYKGKYVLLDFWSSGCGACRSSHKYLRELYQMYNSKGFEILSIAGDINETSWKDAIKSDVIPWTNVSDLKGEMNEVFLMYEVTSLPAYILLDRNGNIIQNSVEKDFDIKKELKKIFEKNGS